MGEVVQEKTCNSSRKHLKWFGKLPEVTSGSGKLPEASPDANGVEVLQVIYLKLQVIYLKNFKERK